MEKNTDKINFLSLNDFKNGKGSLNFDCFTNLEKGFTELEFSVAFPDSHFNKFTEKQLKAYLRNAVNELNKAIEAGEDETVMKSYIDNQMDGLLKFKVLDEKGLGEFMYVKKKAEETILKSHISDAFQYSDNIKITKTGAEIKEKLAQLKVKSEQEKLELKTKIIVLQEKLTDAPTEKADEWYYRGFEDKIGTMYVYSWDKVKNADGGKMIYEDNQYGSNPSRENTCESNLCSEHNKLVREYIAEAAEICYLDMYMNNLKETSSYDLTPSQAAILNF